MNATDFIKQHGVDKAREVVSGAPDRATTVKPSLDFKHFIYGICENAAGAYILLSDLKRLVESLDLVKSYGGIINAKHELILLQKHLNNTFGYVTIITSEKIENLKQAIADVESCMGVSSESN